MLGSFCHRCPGIPGACLLHYRVLSRCASAVHPLALRGCCRISCWVVCMVCSHACAAGLSSELQVMPAHIQLSWEHAMCVTHCWRPPASDLQPPGMRGCTCTALLARTALPWTAAAHLNTAPPNPRVERGGGAVNMSTVVECKEQVQASNNHVKVCHAMQTSCLKQQRSLQRPPLDRPTVGSEHACFEDHVRP